MKLKVIPVLVALLITGTLLFGGWFMYRGYAMESPLSAIVKKNAGVEQIETKVLNSAVQINLTLGEGASLREINRSIHTEGASLLGKRSVQLQINSESSPEIDTLWANALFGVAQAMDTKQYSAIPEMLEEAVKTVPGLTAATEMDDQYVYVRLSDGTHQKYMMLPRVPASIGVWPNE